MFAPTRVWRKWHVKTNLNQKRFATVSALAATAIPSLVLARGHRIEEVDEVPCVVSDAAQAINKTKEAVAALKAVHAHADVAKVIRSTKTRAGRGKTRGRRFQARRGPLVIYAQDEGIVKAFRNIPGVELANVTRLNMLQLAPGGHLGRFCIWTESAFKMLDSIYGTQTTASEFKKGYVLPSAKISNPDVQRIIQSTEVQSVLNAAGPRRVKRPFTQKKNPLKNQGVMFRLNPYAKTYKRRELLNLEAKKSGVPKAERAAKKLSAGKDFKETLLAP
jgi:large subunit ribosomal protein L4e